MQIGLMLDFLKLMETRKIKIREFIELSQPLPKLIKNYSELKNQSSKLPRQVKISTHQLETRLLLFHLISNSKIQTQISMIAKSSPPNLLRSVKRAKVLSDP